MPDLEMGTSDGENFEPGNTTILEEFFENQFQEVLNLEFLNRQNWLLAKSNYRRRLQKWFKASCAFIRDFGRARFDTTLQEQEDWETLLYQFNHQAAELVQMAIIAEEQRRNASHFVGPSSSGGPYVELVNDIVCDSSHASLTKDKLSTIPRSQGSSTGSDDPEEQPLRIGQPLQPQLNGMVTCPQGLRHTALGVD